MKMLDKMQRIESVKSENDFSFEFKQSGKQLGGTLVDLKNANLGYGDKVILDNIDFVVYNNMRVGLLGLNGGGKSTLIKSLIGEIDILSGEIKKHPNLKIGYFSQHSIDVIDGSASPLLQMQLSKSYEHFLVALILWVIKHFPKSVHFLVVKKLVLL
jgi:ATP-binding cassette subfamily F protein 3